MQVTEQMKRDFAQDGAIVVRKMFTSDQMRRLRECFDHAVAHPSAMARQVYPGTVDAHYNEYGNPAHIEQYLSAIRDFGLGDFVASLWDSKHVWFLGEELFIKSGGKTGRSPWHQDTSYLSANGPHLANIWISFEPLPRENALEVVRGSHRGLEYDGTSYMDPTNPTRPLWGDGSFKQLPDIEADRRQNPASWDVLSWDLDPGDALVFHSGTLHGGAPVTPACPVRHTLVFRFFGDKLFYRPLPTVKPDFPYDIREFDDRSMTPGQPFRSPHFAQLR